MLRGLWRLVWLEIKIFIRKPLGVIGSVVIPTAVFVAIGRLFAQRGVRTPAGVTEFVSVALPVFVSVVISLSAVVSLVTIIAIYREGGILKRLRATPLRSHTILAAHVIVKLVFTALTLAVMMMVGARYTPLVLDSRVVGFTVALLFSTLSILSIGFLIASLVPTARFAQPIGSIILYPMIAVSGLFLPVEAMPDNVQTLARMLPLTYAVSLLKGIWVGEAWSAHLGDVAVLVLVFAACAALSAKVFRWE